MFPGEVKVAVQLPVEFCVQSTFSVCWSPSESNTVTCELLTEVAAGVSGRLADSVTLAVALGLRADWLTWMASDWTGRWRRSWHWAPSPADSRRRC